MAYFNSNISPLFAASGSMVISTNGQVMTFYSGGGGGGTIDGSGTTNEITYWVDSNTIGALAVATYPSLDELAYVKGVTSAIQAQLTAKAALASPTFTGTPAAPTATTGTNTTQIATTAFVQTELNGAANVASVGARLYLFNAY